MGDLKGITFSNQAVTPKDDGQLQARLLTDGLISGCGMSYSAATFSLAPGYLIAAGRLLSVPALVYKAVDQATSGYARVLMTIDLTATATKTEFEQAQLSVEYSSTQNGFASLVQGDINGKDSTYQIVLAVMTLGSGGITGIVSTIGVAKPAGAATLDGYGKVNAAQASPRIIIVEDPERTLTATDAGGVIRFASTLTEATLTIPDDLENAQFPLGTALEVCLPNEQGVLNIKTASSATAMFTPDGDKTSVSSSGCYPMFTLLKLYYHKWVVRGDFA